jgi:hypothetical protein
MSTTKALNGFSVEFRILWSNISTFYLVADTRLARPISSAKDVTRAAAESSQASGAPCPAHCAPYPASRDPFAAALGAFAAS